MANTRTALSPYKGYLIIKVNNYRYCINRIINPDKVNLTGKDAVYHLNIEDIAYLDTKYSLEDAHRFIRQHKRNSKLEIQTIWDMQDKLLHATEKDIDNFWQEARQLGIEPELRTYIRYPVATGHVCI